MISEVDIADFLTNPADLRSSEMAELWRRTPAEEMILSPKLVLELPGPCADIMVSAMDRSGCQVNCTIQLNPVNDAEGWLIAPMPLVARVELIYLLRALVPTELMERYDRHQKMIARGWRR